MALNILEKFETLFGLKEKNFNFYYLNDSEGLKHINNAIDNCAIFINSTNTYFVNSAIKSIRLNTNKDIYLKPIVCRHEVMDYVSNTNLVDFFISGMNLDEIINFSHKVKQDIAKFKVNTELDHEQITNIRLLRWAYTRSQDNIPYSFNDFYNKLIGPMLTLSNEHKSYLDLYIFLEKFKNANYIQEVAQYNLAGLMNLSSKNQFKFTKKTKDLIFENYNTVEVSKKYNISSIQNKFISKSYFGLLLNKDKYVENLNLHNKNLINFSFNCDNLKLDDLKSQAKSTLYNTVFETLGENLNIGDHFTDHNSEFFILLSNNYDEKEIDDLIKLLKVKILSELDSNNIDIKLSISNNNTEVKKHFEKLTNSSKAKIA